MIARAQRTAKGWACFACGELIAKPISLRSDDGTVEVSSLEVSLRSNLEPRGVTPEALPIFGLPQRTLRGRHEARHADRTGDRFTRAIKLPVAVYCPRRGVCGRLQRIDVVLPSVAE
jgi:hypothetical protein